MNPLNMNPLTDLEKFYLAVVILSLSTPDRWARRDEVDGAVALLPYRWVAPEWIALWPRLSSGEPGWMVRPRDIGDAFTAILRTNGPRADGFDEATRTLIHLAEQTLDARIIPVTVAGRIMQVAVFGAVKIT